MVQKASVATTIHLQNDIVRITIDVSAVSSWPETSIVIFRRLLGPMWAKSTDEGCAGLAGMEKREFGSGLGVQIPKLTNAQWGSGCVNCAAPGWELVMAGLSRSAKAQALAQALAGRCQ